MTPEQKRDFWQDHFDAWKQSGLTRGEYCRQHDLKLSTFGYWRQRLGAPKRTGKLIPVQVATNATVVIGAGGVRLEVPAALLDEVLPVVLRAVREAP